MRAVILDVTTRLKNNYKTRRFTFDPINTTDSENRFPNQHELGTM